MNKEKAIIVDLDGTLVDIEHRVFFIKKDPPDWKSFMEKTPSDSLHHWCNVLLQAIASKGYKIIIMTARGERWDELTKKWLSDHKIVYHEYYSRKSKDRRPDAEVKKEIYLEKIKDRYDVLFVLDDVKMWRDDLKLVTLQPDWGDF
jgi:FMN phosphatase YigB (HAD superfamily)